MTVYAVWIAPCSDPSTIKSYDSFVGFDGQNAVFLSELHAAHYALMNYCVDDLSMKIIHESVIALAA